MLGSLLFRAHVAIQSFAKRYISYREWRRFQAEVRQQRAEARDRHSAIRDIDARQRERVHAALRAAR